VPCRLLILRKQEFLFLRCDLLGKQLACFEFWNFTGFDFNGCTCLDSFLDNGLVKDIPVLGTIVGLYKSSISISDKLFIKKVLHFLAELKDIPQDKRSEQIQKIEGLMDICGGQIC
jgi:hypothetical protein